MPKRPSIADLSTKHQGEARPQILAGGTFRHNPAHAIGTCANCGGEMVYNVPRMGPDGGFVHNDTGKVECSGLVRPPDAPLAQSKPPRTHAKQAGGVPVAFTGVPPPETEYRFAPPRRWRFDYFWREARIALEVEGGVFTGGRHTRGVGFLKDMEKYNHAALLGIRVFRCTPQQLKTGEIMPLLRQALGY